MMTNKIIETDEIKTLLSLSGSGDNERIELWNTFATDLILHYLRLKTFEQKARTKEKVNVADSTLTFRHFPVDKDSIQLYNGKTPSTQNYAFIAGEHSPYVEILGVDGFPVDISPYSDDIYADYTSGYATPADEVPQAFKTAVAMIVGAGLKEDEKAGGISSYSLGEKSVSFNDYAQNPVFANIKPYRYTQILC